jgi:hypothetical protein
MSNTTFTCLLLINSLAIVCLTKYIKKVLIAKGYIKNP